MALWEPYGNFTEQVESDLGDILGIAGSPEITRIFRWEKGIPQYRLGHADRMKVIEDNLSRIGGLHITGNAYYGIGLNDCVRQSHQVAQEICSNERAG